MTVSIQNARLATLRVVLEEHGLDAYIVPKTDELQLEYVPPSSDRLAWLTGFSGSAGMAVVATERACLFVDGRYTEQAQEQTDSPQWEHRHLTKEPAGAWLEEVLSGSGTVGYSPQVHSPASLRWLRTLEETTGITLKPVDTHLVDGVWSDRPAAPKGAITVFSEELAGASSADKRARMAEALREAGLDFAVLSDPASHCWLLNIRGADLEHTPFALGFVLLASDGSVRTFLDPDKWSAATRSWVEQGGPTTFETPAAFGAALEGLGAATVRVDVRTGTEWVIARIEAGGGTADVGPDPCTLAKACKTDAELAAIRRAHVQDAVALVRFVHWFSEADLGEHDEWSLVGQLAAFREEGPDFQTPSFRTISGFGASGALPHYTVNPATARKIEGDNLYLFDSGGQYPGGTTDVTRVLGVGSPTAEMRRRYTQVLKGHLALGNARFPEGLTGSHLDGFARQPLWEAGIDFDHGTGHGVGCQLSVHEGPHTISKRHSTVALQPGMIVSNEPGYYKPGHFGVRIENLVAVRVADPQPEGAERKTLCFEDLTLCPYDRSLIDLSLLRDDEKKAVDTYHERVRTVLTPLVPPNVAAWLAEATAPLP